jgi:hypothetical protein
MINMSEESVFRIMIKSTPHLALLLLSLFWTYITLGSRVRKARSAFEKQLLLQGMSKDDARRISACFEDLKNNINSVLKQGMTGGFQHR